jgi:hypothetical protein
MVSAARRGCRVKALDMGGLYNLALSAVMVGG